METNKCCEICSSLSSNFICFDTFCICHQPKEEYCNHKNCKLHLKENLPKEEIYQCLNTRHRETGLKFPCKECKPFIPSVERKEERVCIQNDGQSCREDLNGDCYYCGKSMLTKNNWEENYPIPDKEGLTNNGKPHICNTIQVHNNTLKEGVYLCKNCNMPVDKEEWWRIELKMMCERMKGATLEELEDFISKVVSQAQSEGYKMGEQKVTAFYKCQKTGKLGREDNEKSFLAGVKEGKSEHNQDCGRKVMKFIKGKSEQITKHLWYVSDECLEDVERFFKPIINN